MYESYKEATVAKTKSELDAMTKDDLVAYADDMDVETQHSWLKEDIVSAILKGQRAAAKSAPKESNMAEASSEQEQPEVKPVKVTGPINIKGQNYDAGDEVMLTEEEAAGLTEAGVSIEGVEPKTPEEVQAAHDEGREAMNEEIAYRAKSEAEHAARDEAYEDGEEFDEEAWSAEYDRQQTVNDPEYKAPAAREPAQKPA